MPNNRGKIEQKTTQGGILGTMQSVAKRLRGLTASATSDTPDKLELKPDLKLNEMPLSRANLIDPLNPQKLQRN